MAVVLDRDRRWDGLRINSPEDLEPILEGIRFVPQVSEDVIKRFERVKSVIRFSFYDYDLLDVALDYSLLTLELAIKKRYQELEGTEPVKKRFAQLIHWGFSRNLFEPNKKSMQSLRELRGITAHPRRYSLLGYPAYDQIIFIMSLINGMYEDTELRRQRWQVLRKVNDHLREIVKHGANMKADKASTRIFLARLLHVENRFSPAIYHFAFWPIFDMPTGKSMSIDEGEPVIVSASEYDFQERGIRLVPKGDSCSSITVEKLEDPADISSFEVWINTLRQEHPVEVSYIEFELSKIQYFLYTQGFPKH